MLIALPILISTLFISISCKEVKKNTVQNVVADTTITEQTSYNNLFLDSAELSRFLGNNPSFAQYRDQYQDFYKQRNYEFAWFDSLGLSEQAGGLINLLNSGIARFNDSSLYNQDAYNLYNKYKNPEQKKALTDEIINAELLFTGEFFKYVSKVYNGGDIDAKSLGWFIPRKKINYTALLDSTLAGKPEDPESDKFFNPQYKALKEFLNRYINVQKSEWEVITIPVAKYKLHDKSKTIEQIKKRLYLLGDLPENDTTPVFNTEMLHAVKSFEGRMGLPADGIIAKGMIAKLNIPIDTLIQTLLINIERARWMPEKIEEPHIIVNIPEYKLHVYDTAGNFDMNVIVGSAVNNTVIFSGNLRYVVFAPYWNVPSSIVRKEMMGKDKSYFDSHNMEILGRKKDGEPIVRRKPGPDNDLGLVKFLFPNDYNIYLHDTPRRDLFKNSNRSLSHGCIRISDPPKMAAYLLRDQPKFTTKMIDSLMHYPKETWVSVTKPVPVYLVYFTAWVDDHGKLNFRKDIYGHDGKMAAKLF
ncbi:MAG: L,D-transpeptidase family protein [Chitinophagaceae bacterium]|nr:L,D-transpeptidase family protein [Chitinophagaceae bacterium]